MNSFAPMPSSSGNPRGFFLIMPKGMMLGMLVVQILLVGGASLSQATPTTGSTPSAEDQSQTLNLEDMRDEKGQSDIPSKMQRTVYSEDLKNMPPAPPTDTDATKSLDGAEESNFPLPLESPVRKLTKRSTNGGYDPGYESYMQSVHYDPMMAWGKRQNKRKYPSYDPYMQSIAYDPMMAWGKRDTNYDPYLQTIGYDPMSFYAKKTVKRSSENPSYYPQQFFSGDMKSHDPYLDVYIPNHYMHNLKRSISPYLLSLASNDWKRAPNDMGAQGFHEGIFTHNFGDFSPVKRGKREAVDSSAPVEGDTFSDGLGDISSTMEKRRMGMGASGFHGDTFNQGFGDFSTMKKRRMGMGASGFHGDTFNQGFGDFSTMKKRMGASGFYGDTFNQGFGDFSTMKKRRMGMGASGFHGDIFNQGFGDFSTMKKRRPEYDSSGFYGDTFNGGFGDFYTMKRSMDEQEPTLDDSGFYGETVSKELNDYNSMKKNDYEEEEEAVQEANKEKESTRRKRDVYHIPQADKRRPDMDASGFYGDTFSGGFGDFYTMKKRLGAEEGRPKRSLEGNDVPEVEMKPPYERDLAVRNRRSIQETRPYPAYANAEITEDSQDIYKRSIDGSNPFYEGFEDLNTVNGWR